MQLASHLLSCGLPDGHNILPSPQSVVPRHDAGAMHARGGHDDAVGGVAVVKVENWARLDILLTAA
jgi:hypothetical protein